MYTSFAKKITALTLTTALIAASIPAAFAVPPPSTYGTSISLQGSITATALNANFALGTTDGMGAMTLSSGAGATLITSAGAVTLTSSLASADAINIDASNAAGGIDIDAGTNGVTLNTTGNVVITASGTAVLNLLGTTISSSLSAPNAIYIWANGGVGETIQIRADQGTAATSVNIVSDAGGITLNAANNVTITNNATIGGTLKNKIATGAIAGVTVLAAADSGTTYAVSQASSYNITLPATAAGLYYRFVLTTPGSNAVNIVASGDHFYGTIIDAGDGAGNSVVSQLNGVDTLTFVADTAIIGTIIEIYAVTNTFWAVRVTGTTNGGVTGS